MEVLDKCPEFQLVVPCQCRERKSGLDITCENVETGQLETVTENMKKYKEVEEAHIVLEDSDKEVMGDPDKRALYERQRLKQSMQVSSHTQGCEHPNYYHITYLLYLKVICSL